MLTLSSLCLTLIYPTYFHIFDLLSHLYIYTSIRPISVFHFHFPQYSNLWQIPVISPFVFVCFIICFDTFHFWSLLHNDSSINYVPSFSYFHVQNKQFWRFWSGLCHYCNCFVSFLSHCHLLTQVHEEQTKWILCGKRSFLFPSFLFFFIFAS